VPVRALAAMANPTATPRTLVDLAGVMGAGK
jgi:hypothetical protein